MVTVLLRYLSWASALCPVCIPGLFILPRTEEYHQTGKTVRIGKKYFMFHQHKQMHGLRSKSYKAAGA